MAYILDGTEIRRPSSGGEQNSTQVAQVRTLSGAINRDYFGSNKRVWSYDFVNVNPTDYTTLQSIYTSYLTSGSAITWQVSEDNYTVSSTNVHIDLLERAFKVKGSSYLSDFTLVLTEA